MRTPQLNSKAKEKLMDAAEELMAVKGFAATSVEEICRKAKLTKGSFFHYFQCKEDLGKELLKRFSLACQYKMKEMVLKETDPLERVYGYLEFAVSMAEQFSSGKGCLVGNFAQQMSDTHPQIRLLCAQAFDEWIKIFKADLDSAKKTCASRIKLDTQGLAEYFVAVLEGSQILAKTRQDPVVVRKNMEHFKRYLKGVFGR